MDERNIKRYVLRASCFLLLAFLFLGGYVAYLQTVAAQELNENPYNRRMNAWESETIRGSIRDRNGELLAYSPAAGQRAYPYGAAAEPVTGYTDPRLGSSELEAYGGAYLSGRNPALAVLGPIAQLFQAGRGDDLHITLDAKLQKLAYDTLNGHKGAIVILEAKTGAILVMASAPSFSPETVAASWNALLADANSPLLNRAAQGLYPPGSSIKPLILDEALRKGVTDTEEIFDCKGFLPVGNTQIRESHGVVHGPVNVEEALIESCNVTFGTLALRLQGDNLAEAFRRYGFTRPLGGETLGLAAHLPDFPHLQEGETAQIGIGQSTLLVTPLQMALLADAIANDGKAMTPYLIQSVTSPSGAVLKQAMPTLWVEATSPQMASLLDGYMQAVVEKGTGHYAQVAGVRVTGKTGTAENAQGDDHAWFIGSAEKGERKIAFAVLVENGGGGGLTAAPIAKKLIEAWAKE